MHVLAGDFRGVQDLERREVHHHFRFCFGAVGHLKLDLYTIDGQVTVIRHGIGWCNQGAITLRQRLAQARIHMAAFARRQHGAELVNGTAAHRWPGNHVLGDRVLHKAGRRIDTRFAGCHIFIAGHALYAAPVVDVVMGVEHRNNRLLRTVLVVQLQAGPGGGGRQ